MELEKEIKQEKFKSEYQKMLVNILFTGSWIEANNIRFLKPYGISPQQLNILNILQSFYPQPASINSLSERMLDKMSNASRLVEKLRLKSLVERRPGINDRREVEVVITKKGMSLIDSLEEARKEIKGAFAGISLNEAKQVNKVLDKLRK